AVVNVSGSAVAQGNTSGNNTKVSDDVYFGSGDKSLLNVKSPLSGCVGISYATPNMAEGEVCARLDGWTGPDERTLAAIVQSQKPLDFEPAVCETNETLLVWKAADKSEKSVPEELADVRMTKAGSESACYQTLVAALSLLKEDESVLIELLHDIDFTNSLSTASAEGRVPVRGSVVLDGRGFTVSRRGSLTLDVAERSSLVLTNIVLSAADGDVAGSGGTNAYLRTVGGSITLAAGAKIRDLAGGGSRAAGAVAVQRGVFTMEPGSEISNCINYYVNVSEGTGCGGGVLVDEGTVYLRGGIVTGCAAYRGGGVALANKTVAYVSGSVGIYGNTDLDGNPSNLMASDIKAEEHGCTIILEGELASGAIGYIEGTYADTNIFGKVSAEYLERATTNELLKSAGRFTHDSRDVVGVVVTNSAGALLVWSDAVDPSGRFVAGDGAEYRTLDATADEEGKPETIPCLPFTFTSIVETPDGKWRLTLAPGVGYCTYSLYASDVPLPAASAGTAAAWGAPVAVTNLVSDGEFMFEVESSTAKKFWAVKGEDGVK
ncbi:MAG: hypothetical protein IKD42_04005, partial [Kiritimatiellae bacterium]|nr:hypothetical protein [Kiritimatiellia bacterium]